MTAVRSHPPKDDALRFACWAAFWGDTEHALEQVLRVPDIDYLVSDHLAEITMALLARARARDPQVGYVTDAVDALERFLPELHKRGIKVVTNAGGLNVQGCADALQAACARAGVALKVAAVVGDDLMPRLDTVLAGASKDMFTGETVPSALTSLNAYLGAGGVAAALGAGADLVVTGRCVDAAVVLGPLMHEFGWADADHGLLSGGTLVGHILECGPQCTGGLHTDWWLVPGWENMGYPLADVRRDATATIFKPEGTGGLISPATVGEQVVYEIGDPGAYVTPDVVCDWREVTLDQAGPDRVEVGGARGSAPPRAYKATATVADGFRALTTAMFAGADAAGRGRRFARALVSRANALNARAGISAFDETSVEVIGAGDTRGPDRHDDAADEVVVKIGVRHADRAAVETFARELAPMGLVAQGMTGVFAGRPRPAPRFRVLHLLVDKAEVPVLVRMGGSEVSVVVAPGGPGDVPRTPPLEDVSAAEEPAGTAVPLRRIAYARSGDKGDKANIGLIARRPEFLAVIRDQVTTARVADVFAHYIKGGVSRWDMPGVGAVNYLLDAVLGGSGGTSTLRYDPQGKSYAAMLLSLPVVVPDEWLQRGLLGPEAADA